MSELVVALDYPEAAPALAMARGLAGLRAPSGSPVWVKVGLELYCAAGSDMVRALAGMGFPVFVDLKFFDIPNTVRGAVASAVRAGARMVNIHTLGGARMAEAAREGLEAAPPGGRPLLLGVTVLTSMADEDLDLLAAGRSASELAVVLAGRAKAYYLDGVVCSGLEIRAVKRACGEGFCCLTPGIRPFAQEGGKAGDDQRRVVTAERAAGDGADYLVVGRPITAADDPLLAARNVLEMIERGERAREREP